MRQSSEGITHHSSLWTPVTQTHQHPEDFWISVWNSTWSALWTAMWHTESSPLWNTSFEFLTTLQDHKEHSKNTPAQSGLNQVFKVCSHCSLNEQVKVSCLRGLRRSHPRDTRLFKGMKEATADSKLQPVLRDSSCNQKVWPGHRTRNHSVTPSAALLTQSWRFPDYLTHDLFLSQYISRFHPKCSTGAGAHLPFLCFQQRSGLPGHSSRTV